MKNFSWLFVIVLALSVSKVSAQTVATIGLGDINYKVDSDAANSRNGDATRASFARQLSLLLLDTRKFKLLDSYQLKQKLAEHELTPADYYQGDLDSAAYEMTGLDYILTGSITEFGIFERSTGPEGSEVGVAEADLRLIATSYGSEDASVTATAQLLPEAGSTETNKAEVLDQTLLQLGNDAIEQMMAVLFPLRVMKISEQGLVSLNYGQGLLAVGDTIQVFERASASNNGAVESGPPQGAVIATLEVVSTSTKFSTARILDGADRLERGLKAEIL
ncbi:MAG: hypothetical protein AAF431_06535 [Pseudomonadota bacterium]